MRCHHLISCTLSLLLLLLQLPMECRGEEDLSTILNDIAQVNAWPEKVAAVAQRWPAINTPEGYNTLMDVWEQTPLEQGLLMDACIRLMRHTTLSLQDQGLVFARRAKATDDPWSLSWNFHKLINNRYDDDLIPFYTQYLDDRRPLRSAEPRSPESVGMIARLCDKAMGGTLRALERKKILTESDAPFQVPADELTWEERDVRITLLIPILEKHGLMYYQGSAAPVIFRQTPLDGIPRGAAPNSAPTTPLAAIPITSPRAEEKDTTWWYLVAAALIAGAALFHIWRTRRAR